VGAGGLGLGGGFGAGHCVVGGGGGRLTVRMGGEV